MRGDSGQPIVVATSALLSKLEKAGLDDNWSTREDQEQEVYAQGDSGMYTAQELSLIRSVRVLLQGMGEDVSRNGLLKTPLRVARAFLSATAGCGTSVESVLREALFTESGPESGTNKWLAEVGGGGGGSGGMVVVRDIDLFPTCESCLLPFRVCCHIAYIPSKQRVVGLSKLPRVAEVYASRLQNPERLVKDIGAGLSEGFHPVGIAVLAECWHLKWPEGCGHTGVEPVDWIRRTVSFGEGDFRNRSSGSWDEFRGMLQLVGKNMDFSDSGPASCPLMVSTPTAAKLSNGLSVKLRASNLEAMVQAVRSLLVALGEDPDRDELKQTPLCYVRWLLASTQGSRGFWEASIGKLNGGFGEVEVATGGLRAVLDLPFCSQCEHHLLPFSGVAHVGFSVEAGKQEFHWDKLSLQRILKLFSCRLQVQERLTKQIAEAVMSSSSSSGVLGVMVVLEASHICMISRGVKKVGSSTATMATLGEFGSNVKARTEFLHRISARR